jgi:hypothetical protein
MTHVPPSPEDKLRILEDERRANTRVAYGDVVDPLPQGRWKKPAQPSDPAKLYPPLPPTSAWACDPVGLEPPFPVDIEAVEPCGTEAEIERVLAEPVGSPPADSRAEVFSSLGTDAGPPLYQDRQPAPSVAASVATDAQRDGADALVSGPASSSGDRQLAASSADAEVAPKSEGANTQVEHRRGGAVFHSRGSMTRRFG